MKKIKNVSASCKISNAKNKARQNFFASVK